MSQELCSTSHSSVVLMGSLKGAGAQLCGGQVLPRNGEEFAFSSSLCVLCF